MYIGVFMQLVLRFFENTFEIKSNVFVLGVVESDFSRTSVTNIVDVSFILRRCSQEATFM